MKTANASDQHSVVPAHSLNAELMHDYELLYQCIMSDQVPENDICKMLEDKGFHSYFMRRRGEASGDTSGA